MNILITGGGGQLGSALAERLYAYGMQFDTADLDTLDITDLKQVRAAVDGKGYTHIVNCAAYTDVNGCESESAAAYAVNALGARNLAIAAEMCGAEIVHISTDYVFDGQKREKPYTVYDLPNPVSVYGKTKLAGEGYVRDFSTRYYIVRTAWLYGKAGGNFVKTILRLAAEREEIKVVSDQIGCPTNAEDLAEAVAGLMTTGEYGVYHCTGKGYCSWYDFAERIVALSGMKCRVLPCTTEEYPTPAKRPAYSVLDCSSLNMAGIDVMRDWGEALFAYMAELQINGNNL